MKENEKLMTVPIDDLFYRQVRATAALKGLSLSEFVRITLKTEIQKEKESQKDVIKRN